MKYMFNGCETLKQLEERCLELAELYKNMRADKVKLIDTDGCYFWFETSKEDIAKKYEFNIDINTEV